MADLLVALTGGIASGKTTVASILDELGATVFDSDQIARQVVEPGTVGAKKVAESFGEEVFEQGVLNRAKLGQIVFSDSNKRSLLESILHPLIQETSNRLFKESKGIIVYQIPLLAESEGSYEFDFVVTVEANESSRVKRLSEHRGMSERDAIARIGSQASRETRESIADYVIDSDCTLEELRTEVIKLWQKLQEMRLGKLGFS